MSPNNPERHPPAPTKTHTQKNIKYYRMQITVSFREIFDSQALSLAHNEHIAAFPTTSGENMPLAYR